MTLTPRLDLRGGQPCWHDADAASLDRDDLPQRADILVVGAGMTGAALAYRLARDGHRVACVDRRTPATGSIAASTALVMWAADTPLLHLARQRGERRAAAAWNRVRAAVTALDRTIREAGIDCGWHAKSELYLAGTLLDAEALQAECALRANAGLPSSYLAAGEVAERFGLPPRAALLSTGCFSVDPVALTVGLLRAARGAGATLSFPTDIVGLDARPEGVRATTADGDTLEARTVVLATGYEASRLFLPDHFAAGASFAIATPPATTTPGSLPLVWEASDPYLYQRTTSDGRIIVGGRDEPWNDPVRRDAALSEKRGSLAAAGAALLGRDILPVDCAWAATFGRSPDGLPAIGPARNLPNLYLAAGFGGNGISFAALAAQLIAAALEGKARRDDAAFDPYRPQGR